MASLSGLSLTVEAPYERSLPVKIARSCRSQRGYHKYVASASCKAITGGDYDNAAYWLWRRRNALEDGYFPGISNRSNARMAKCVRAVGSSGFTEAEGGRRDVSKDALKTTPEISKKALGMQKNLLQQIAERKKLVASLKESIISTESNVISSSKPEESLADLDLLALNSVKLEGEAVSEFRTDIYAKSTSSKMPKISVVGGKGRPTTVEPQAIGATQVESPIAVALGLMRETDATVNNTVTVPLTVPETSKPLEAQVENLEAILIEEVEKQEGTSEEGNVKSPPLAGENAMNVILVSAECAPWSKAGGLGDVAGSLPKALARRGHRVMVVAPRYGLYAEAQQIGSFRRYQVDGQDMEVAYHHAYIDGVDFVFLDSGIFRNWNNNIYGGGREDILKRMVLLCKASVEVPWYVPCGGSCYGDGNLVFIANDWHTALLPVYLKAYYRDNGLMTYARSVLVIHNIAHQGRGPVADFRFVGLPGHYLDHFRLYDPVGGEHCNIFAAGIKAADRVVTVSHGYSWEVKTPEGGWGLHAIIGESDWKLRGIVNGIDMNDWNPEVDINLKSDGYTNYSLETLRTGKAQCKAALQRELGLPLRDDAPLVGFIGRLDYQKGIDLIEQAMPWMAGQDVQLVLLGTGRADLEEMLKRVQAEHPGKVRSWVGFSVKMAHRIIAGSDVLLMPSRFEPCGLNQLYAMKYGTIPVVHAVGGLRDTVQPFDPFTDSGHGWTFDRAEAQKLINALGNCFNTYRNHKGSWEGLQRRGMTQDLSWDNAALLYEEVLVAAKYQW